MEKLVYLLWNESGRADAALAEQLLGPVADALLALDPAALSGPGGLPSLPGLEPADPKLPGLPGLN